MNTQQQIKRIRKPGGLATPNLDRLLKAVENGWADLGAVMSDQKFLNDFAAESKKTRMQQAMEQPRG